MSTLELPAGELVALEMMNLRQPAQQQTRGEEDESALSQEQPSAQHLPRPTEFGLAFQLQSAFPSVEAMVC